MKRFESFRLDPVNHCLWRGGTRVLIAPKAFDVLRYLVERPGKLVSQDEILDALWPNTYVNPEVIKKYVLSIRRVLGDDIAKPVFIETVPRRGYQFIAQVTDQVTAVEGPAPRGATAIVGRDNLLAQLDRRLADALAGRRQIVFVTGEAGIGKSALVDTFVQGCLGRGQLQIARGQCVEGFGGREPYYPMLEALAQLVGSDPDSPIVQLLISRAPTWLVQFPALIRQAWRPALQEQLLGATRERMVREMCELLEAWTVTQPLALILEDLHWVDPSTLDLIATLARRREPSKLLLVTTLRPDDAARSGSRLGELKLDLLVHHLSCEITLQPLDEADCAAYLCATLPASDLPQDLAHLVARRSGGNPLFVREITQELVTKGALAKQHGRWQLTQPVNEFAVSVPETLQQVIDLQFQRLSAAEQRVLRSASACGDRFSIWSLAAAVDMPVDEIEQVCEALAADARFIRPMGLQEIPDEGFSAIYEFRHVLFREAVYRSLSEMNRVRLHRRIGERLKALHTLDRPEGAAEIAMHLQRAGQHEDAVRHLVMAAQNAARRFAYRGAIGILQDALELLKKVNSVRRAETECLIVEQIGDIHYWLGDMSDSERAYRAQAALAAAAADRGAEITALGRLLLPLGFIDPDRGVALAERAAALSTDLDARSSALAVMQAAAYRCIYDRWEEREWQRWTAAFELVRRSGQASLPPYLDSLHCYLLVVRGAQRDVLRCIEMQVPIGTHQTPTPVLHLFTMSVKTVALMRAGRFGELLQLLRAEQELAARNGTDPWLCVLREAWLRTLMLDYEGACRLCERAVSGGTAYPTSQLRAIESVARGHRALDREQYLEAHECFARVCDLHATPKFFLHWLWRMTARAGLSETWLRAGDIGQARRHADDFLEAATSAADPHMHARAWDLQARICMAEHDATAARNAIQKALAILGTHDVPTVAWQVHATAAGVLGRGKAARAAAQSHRAHAVSCITQLANTFAPDEPLRELFLSAAPVRQIVDSQQDAALVPA